MSGPPGVSRYDRQIRMSEIGPDGQARIASARVAVVGLGALGGVAAGYLARAGVGTLRLIDRDIVEEHNLQRQILFNAADAREGRPKAVAAADHLAAANPEIRIEARVEHLGADCASAALGDCDLVVDGTDNFETRFLINDLSVREGIPWIYGGAVGREGLVALVWPGRTPCLRCLVPPHPAAIEPTCETAGILGPLAGAVGSLQAGLALRLLARPDEPAPRGVIRLDIWTGRLMRIGEELGPDPGCPVCGRREFAWLEGGESSRAAILCGSDAVQILPSGSPGRDLALAARRLAPLGEVRQSEHLVRARVESYTLSLFADGRVIVSGTRDPDRARSVVDRYLGNS